MDSNQNNNLDGNILMINSLLKKNKKEQALEFCQQSLHIYNNNVRLLEIECKILLLLGDYYEFEKKANKLLFEFPDSLDGNLYYAYYYIKKKDFESGRLILDKLILKYPSEYRVHNYLALLYLNMGDYFKSIKYSQDSIKLHSSIDSVIYYLLSIEKRNPKLIPAIMILFIIIPIIQVNLFGLVITMLFVLFCCMQIYINFWFKQSRIASFWIFAMFLILGFHLYLQINSFTF
jgi:tetratricopeptide (TPR) repeat protein